MLCHLGDWIRLGIFLPKSGSSGLPIPDQTTLFFIYFLVYPGLPTLDQTSLFFYFLVRSGLLAPNQPKKNLACPELSTSNEPKKEIWKKKIRSSKVGKLGRTRKWPNAAWESCWRDWCRKQNNNRAVTYRQATSTVDSLFFLLSRGFFWELELLQSCQQTCCMIEFQTLLGFSFEFKFGLQLFQLSIF